MPKTSLHAFKAKVTRFVADWLKRKDLHKLFSVFEGIQQPFILSLACKSVVLNHVYIHSFRSIIKATEKFPGGGGIWSPGMDLWRGIWTAFRPREGGIWTKILQKTQMPGGCPGGDVEASIWLVHFNSKDSEINFDRARSTTVKSLLGALRAICNISSDDGEDLFADELLTY